MEDVNRATAILHDLKELGLHLSIDDFGTGYTNLRRLKDLPIDKLKMDISCVREITDIPADAVLARTIVTIAHNFNFRVIAVGVENKEQFSYLRAHGCDEAQGYYFSHPLAADECRLFFQEKYTLS
jgi:EAL domain-containing protein (putative c-di-GMP-specific phosphodiesterase class I)